VELTPDQITIAITVYHRRPFLTQAIESALDQTRAARVILVDDCGPDASLGADIRSRYGSAVGYHRNPQRRGLFDNWNACLELCQTPWISILHDDDFLLPEFVAATVELSRSAPGRGLYLGTTGFVDEMGQPLRGLDAPAAPGWTDVDLEAAAFNNTFLFPGQLFRVDDARALGGFRATSRYCGDWEMWFKLAARYGAAKSGAKVACLRIHGGHDRGTTSIERSGKKYGLENVQRKRNVALLSRNGRSLRFDRVAIQAAFPLPIKFLLTSAAGSSDRILAYNVELLRRSRAPNWRYRAFQALTAGLGSQFPVLVSRIWNFRRRRQTQPVYALSGSHGKGALPT